MNADENAARSVFEAALGHPSEARPEFVARACGANVELRQRVEALLKALEQAGPFLDFLPDPIAAQARLRMASSAALNEKPGDWIGRYRLLEKIGEGGCGVVYMAAQDEPVRRRVALKVIKLGMDTAQVIGRFEAERQALALMEHPNIAKILDAGATESGRPFFVMELVRGVRITDYCDQQQLTTEQRLQLLVQVCQAVQHAHQKGIIHRDIKPSNILVTSHDGVPVPKVIDFGIAKATDQARLTEKTVFTAFAQFLGTPAYMSPEQAELSGLDIDTRSDIYSLGVLLYELLTGNTPFDAKELWAAGLDAMRRTIREKEPAKPSTRLSTMLAADLRAVAQRHQVAAPRLLHSVRGDLDWIVMKTLEKDRQRRYATANDLAQDLRRHLSHEPVIARSPSAAYRFQKLVLRNKLAFGAGAAVVAALLLGLGFSVWSLQKEKQARQRADQEAEKSEKARQRADQEAEKSELVAAFLKGMLEEMIPSAALDRGRSNLWRALNLELRNPATGPTPEEERELATRIQAVTAMLRDMLNRTEGRLGAELAGQPEVQAVLRSAIGKVYWAMGDYAQAETTWRELLQASRGLWGEEHENIATLKANLAMALCSQGELEEAETLIRQALEMHRRLLSPSDPQVELSLHNLALVLRALGKWPEAEARQREALALTRGLGGAGKEQEAASLNNLAAVLLDQDKLVEAERAARDALAIHEKTVGRESEPAAISRNLLAMVLRGTGELAEAEAVQRQALATLRNLVGTEHPLFADFLDTLALVRLDQGRLAEAEDLDRQALALRRKLREKSPDVALLLNNLGLLQARRGNLPEAKNYHREALVMRRELLPGAHPDQAESLYQLGRVMLDEGQPAESEALLRQSLAIRERTLPENWRTFEARRILGECLMNQQKFTEAEPLLLSGYHGLNERTGVMPAYAKDLLLTAVQKLVWFYQATAQTGRVTEWKARLPKITEDEAGKTSPP